MLIRLDNLLNAGQVAHCRRLLLESGWVDGNVTSGTQAAQTKKNLQLPESSPVIEELRLLVMRQLHGHALFYSAALPRRIYPPMFNRYGGEMNAFGDHVDNAMRVLPDGTGQLRTDLSCTLFLSNPEDYDGGELIIDDDVAGAVKLNAGDAVLYPGTSVHRVSPVTRGVRLASFFWVESLVREQTQRTLLFNMDLAIMSLRQQIGDTPAVVQLTNCYHNLIRQWANS